MGRGISSFAVGFERGQPQDNFNHAALGGLSEATRELLVKVARYWSAEGLRMSTGIRTLDDLAGSPRRRGSSPKPC